VIREGRGIWLRVRHRLIGRAIVPRDSVTWHSRPAAIGRLDRDKRGLDRNIFILLDHDLTPKIEYRRLDNTRIGVLYETRGAVEECDRYTVLDA